MTSSRAYVCNMCHSVGMYDEENREYNYPIMGALFLNDAEYVRFCERLDTYLDMVPEFRDPKPDSDYAQQIGTPWYRVPDHLPEHYPVMHLGDVEIHWIHETSVDEVRTKYMRRLERFRHERPTPVFMWDSASMMNTHTPDAYTELVRRYLALPTAYYLTKYAEDLLLDGARVALVSEWLGTSDERHPWHLLKYITACGDCKPYYRQMLSQTNWS